MFRSNGGNDTIVGTIASPGRGRVGAGPGHFGAIPCRTTATAPVRSSNGTHSITFTGTVPPQFQNGPDQPAVWRSTTRTLRICWRWSAIGPIRDSSGYGNNDANPTWGAAGQQFIRLTDAHYTDGAAGIRQTALTPREISDILSNQDNDGDGVEESIPNAFGGTSLLTFFGQYFDHGLDFVAKGQPGNGRDRLGPPSRSMRRVRTSSLAPWRQRSIPAQYVNQASPYVDQNQAYGSHDAITDLLAQVGGRLQRRARSKPLIC